MRVVAGSARGRRLADPAGTGRAADHRPGARGHVQRARFDGRGRRGGGAGPVRRVRSARDRGAVARAPTHVTFVDTSPRRARGGARNLGRCGLGGPRHGGPRRRAGRSSAASEGTCDLVLLDPPYAFDRWPELLARSRDRRWSCIESDRPGRPGAAVRRAEATPLRRYGGDDRSHWRTVTTTADDSRRTGRDGGAVSRILRSRSTTATWRSSRPPPACSTGWSSRPCATRRRASRCSAWTSARS